MSYNSVQSLRSYSLCSGSFDSVPDGVVQYWLDYSQNVIDSSLASHFHGTLPFASGSVPNMVMSMENTICAYKLLLSEGFNPGRGDNNQGAIQQAYIEVVGLPNDPASGQLGQLRYAKMKLVGPDINNQELEPVFKTSVGVTGQPSRCWQQGSGRTVY